MKEIKWTNNSPLADIGINPIYYSSIMMKTVGDKIKDYVESQIQKFLEEEHISIKRWQKYGIIERWPDDTSLTGFKYILVYKTRLREIRRMVYVDYKIVIK